MADLQQFAAKVRELIAQAREIPAGVAGRIVAMLEGVQTDLLGRITAQHARVPGSFTETQLRAILNEAESRLREFRIRASGAIHTGQERAFDLGVRMADAPLAEVDVRALLGNLSRQQLVVAQGYSADLVRGLAGDARTQFNGILRRAVLGGKPMNESIAELAKLLGGDGGFFDAVTSRASRIVHTEVPRVQSIATQARLEQFAVRVPGMQKRWRHSPGQEHPRLDHMAMDGQTVGVDEKFVTPGGAELMYPRDPEAPAGETVNCACFVVPVPPAARKAA